MADPTYGGTKRIIDETEVSVAPSDAYIVVDGETSGTNKMSYDNAIANPMSILNQSITSLEGTTSTLTSQMSTANTNISSLQTSMTNAQGDIDSLETRMDTAENDIDNLQTATSSLQSEMTDVSDAVRLNNHNKKRPTQRLLKDVG